MEKKIMLFLPLSIAIYLSCTSKGEPEHKSVDSDKEIIHDTIFFETDKIELRDVFLYSGASKFDQGLLLSSSGKGKSIWVDRVLYGTKFKNGFFVIVSSLDLGPSLLYYAGDSLCSESAGFKNPIINEYRGATNKVVCVSDSVFGSGYLNKVILCYYLDANGVLKDKQEFFPKKVEGNDQYDVDITISHRGNQFYILKNGYPLVHYKL